MEWMKYFRNTFEMLYSTGVKTTFFKFIPEIKRKKSCLLGKQLF